MMMASCMHHPQAALLYEENQQLQEENLRLGGRKRVRGGRDRAYVGQV